MQQSRRHLKRISFLCASIYLIVLQLPSFAQSACREPDVARGFGSVAYAAEPDATIQYFGHNFFLITTRKGTRIVTDPLGPGWYPTPRLQGDVVTVGREHFNHNYVQLVEGKPLILRGLKNYGAEWNKVSLSFKDIFVYNVPVYQNAASTDAIRGAAFVFDLGTLCIVHLGDLAHALSPEHIKEIGKVDVALTPIDGRRTMPPDVAREVLNQLKPKIAIPMHYRDNMYLIKEFTAGIKTQMMNTDTLAVSKAALPGSLEIRVLRQRGAMSYE